MRIEFCGAVRTIKSADKSGDSLALLLLMLLIVGYAGFSSAYQIQRHRAFQTYVDLMAMEQAIWNTRQGHFMRSTVYPPAGRVV